MYELEDLYQELIIDHSKRPRNFHTLSEPAQSAAGFNPLCGDKITVYLKMDGDVIQDVSFEGSGCAISTASASLMTESLKGKTRAEADALFRRVHKLLTEEGGDQSGVELGKLAVFSGVREFPVRVKCASLPWHTFVAAMEKKAETVTTE
jgi:nitrogen fixation NifU-like protein